jgi:hypothetical protein
MESSIVIFLAILSTTIGIGIIGCCTNYRIYRTIKKEEENKNNPESKTCPLIYTN